MLGPGPAVVTLKFSTAPGCRWAYVWVPGSCLLPLCSEASRETTQELKWWTRTRYSRTGNPFPKFRKKSCNLFSSFHVMVCAPFGELRRWRRENHSCTLVKSAVPCSWEDCGSPCGYVEHKYAACFGCYLLGRGHPISGYSEELAPVSWASPKELGLPSKLFGVFS